MRFRTDEVENARARSAIATRRERQNEEMSLRIVWCVPCTAAMWTVHAMPPADLDLIELHAFAVALARSIRGADRSSVVAALVRVMPLFRLQEAPANALPEEEQSTWESAESFSLQASH